LNTTSTAPTARRVQRPAPSWTVIWLAPVLAVLQLSSVAAEVITSLAFKPQYNWVTNTISELGVAKCTPEFDPRKGVEACSPLADVMNGAMVISGLSLIVLAILLRQQPGFRKPVWPIWCLAGLGHEPGPSHDTGDTKPHHGSWLFRRGREQCTI